MRSEDYSSYLAALDANFNAPNLTSILTDEFLTINSVDYCVKESGDADPTPEENRIRTAINLARSLLTRPDNPASHVLVSDTGIEDLADGNPWDHLSQLVLDLSVGLNTPQVQRA